LGSVPALDLRWTGPETASLVDLIYVQLDDFEPLALHDRETFEASSVVFDSRVFFKTSALRDAAASALLDAFATEGLAVDRVDVEDENWAKRSQESLRAVHVGRIVVAPPWNVPAPAAEETIVIEIEPSMGFGTGHHETTRLCLALLQELMLDGRSAIDVGTGSGVLAIAASKLGASAVVAFDEDPQALENARENIDRNGVAAIVDVRELDLGAGAFVLPPAAVVMANLTSGVLLKHAERLKTLVDADGVLLISGFSPDDLEELVAAFGTSDVHGRTKGAWAAALLRFTDSPARN
jgi:ribosomal protein L11 methyltransferase